MRGVRMAAMVVASLFVMLLITTSVAMAQTSQDPYGGGQPQVSPRTQFRGQNETQVRGELLRRPTQESERAGLLPFTGADLTLFVATGLALTATGAIIVRRARARSDS